MTIRRMTLSDISQVLDLIERSSLSELVHTTAEALHSGSLEFEQTFPEMQWKQYVWEENGLQGTFVLHWNPQNLLLEGTPHYCVLYETFWDPKQPELLARQVMLEAALQLVREKNLQTLVVLQNSLNGDLQTYRNLGGEWVQLKDSRGRILNKPTIAFCLE
ncbi:hypothetical protein [Deinococcus roseus]|uniref:N-acetyltransferase domain-containing protein n=1 Tax=Deinococcus roseus TaxID=392414 RepID=A0ABQ2CY71_9DEIO|nr:hypothetical protein [Deinococcus roseus]GGJ32507.1 hypothetical protein GCM10008938_18390 [Deinococcus roseus]